MPTQMSVQDAIREALDQDSRLSHPSEVAVLFEEGVPTLPATVGSCRHRLAAVRDARKVPGVQYVEDQIEVRILDPDTRSDAEVRGFVLQGLASDPDVPADLIDVKVTDGVVTLSGEVSYQFQS